MWAKLTGPLREFGVGAGLLYAADRLLRRLSPQLGLYVYELMVQPIGGKALLPASRTRQLTFRRIERGDPAIETMPARPDIKQARFDQGAICLGVYRNETLLGFAWFCFTAYDEDEVRCTYALALADRSVFDFDFYVFPEHRMGIGFMAVWHGANEYLQARGVRYTFSRMTRFNIASRRAHARLGARRVGSAVFVRAWSVELMLASLAPFVFVSFSQARRPRLWLRPDVLPGS